MSDDRPTAPLCAQRAETVERPEEEEKEEEEIRRWSDLPSPSPVPRPQSSYSPRSDSIGATCEARRAGM